MPTDPVMSGEVPADGIVPVLQAVERQCTTGVLRFESGAEQGEVKLVRGEPASEQPPMPDGRDPVDALLALREGRYEVHQKLPSLPVSQGDAQRRSGSLAVHVPADLMTYCERAGLTGLLTLESDERQAQIIYDRGELVGIRLDGRDDDDLLQVFGWEEGQFRIEASTHPPRFDDGDGAPGHEADPGAQRDASSGAEPASERSSSGELPSRDPTGRQLLRVVEVALGQIVEDRERRRPGSRSSPELPSFGQPRRSHPSASASFPPERNEPPPRPDPTVKVVYLSAGPHDPAGGERRATAGDEAAPGPRPSGADGERGAGAPAHGRAARNDGVAHQLLGAVGWMVALILLALAAVALLAQLPPVE